jgi:hypothetical protein
MIRSHALPAAIALCPSSHTQRGSMTIAVGTSHHETLSSKSAAAFSHRPRQYRERAWSPGCDMIHLVDVTTHICLTASIIFYHIRRAGAKYRASVIHLAGNVGGWRHILGRPTTDSQQAVPSNRVPVLVAPSWSLLYTVQIVIFSFHFIHVK